MRVIILTALAALAAVSACARRQAGGSPKPDSLRQDLACLLEDESASLHRILRDASNLTQERCLGKDWKNVASSLRRQRVPLIKDNVCQYHTERTYRIADGRFSPSQPGYVFFVRLSEDQRSPEHQKATPGKVMSACAGFRWEINRSYEPALVEKLFPPDSVMVCILRQPEVLAATSTYPILQSVEVTYGWIGDRWREFNPSGFSVDVTLIADSSAARGKSILFTVASGLDPLRAWDGTEQLDGFKPTDTLGEVRKWGSHEWGP